MPSNSPTPRAPEGDEPTQLDVLIRVLKSACQNNDAATAFGAERGLRDLFARLRSVSEDARTGTRVIANDGSELTMHGPDFLTSHWQTAAAPRSTPDAPSEEQIADWWIAASETLAVGDEATQAERFLADAVVRLIDRAALAPAAPAERPTANVSCVCGAPSVYRVDNRHGIWYLCASCMPAPGYAAEYRGATPRERKDA